MQDKLGILECLIFLSGDGITKEEIMAGLEVSQEEFETLLSQLKEKYSGGLVLKEFSDKIVFSTSAEMAGDIESILSPVRARKFSASILETLAIVAYKQPITRQELESVRGVSCDWAISQLLKDDIVEIVGRKDVVGRPQQFGTTDEFLKKFGMKDLADLPDYNIIEAKIKEEKEGLINPNSSAFFLPQTTGETE